MKINGITVQNFQRLRLIDVDLSGATVHLFAGANEAGKSSLQEAVRYCLLGDTVRVSKKSDYSLMVTDGAKDGSIEIRTDTGTMARTVKKGEATGGITLPQSQADALPYVLDATKFAGMKQADRRAFMLGLTGTKINGTEIGRRLKLKGIGDAEIERILPSLRNGFEAAHKVAMEQATSHRAAWKALAGENYGSVKAEEWTAPVPDMPADTLPADKLRHMIEAMDDEIQDLAEQKGAANARISAQKEASRQKPLICPHCKGETHLRRERPQNTSEDRVYLVRADKPTADESPQPETQQADMSVIMECQHKIDKLQAEKREVAQKLAEIERIQYARDHAKEITEKAAEHHKQVKAWEKASDALAPDGIPAEILADALKPINDRLRVTSMATGWAQVTLTAELEIEADGRPYGLHSESAQWRIGAAIAEAIAHLAGVRLLILDRADVLDLPNRTALLKWLASHAEHYETILLFATLKELPAKLPAGFAGYWIENGQIITASERAA